MKQLLPQPDEIKGLDHVGNQLKVIFRVLKCIKPFSVPCAML
jgi:hypothetical protein